MKNRIAVATALLATTLIAGEAHGLGTISTSPSPTVPAYAVEYGKAMPPIGYVKFCAESPGECLPKSIRANRLAMDPERWNTLYQVNTFVNGRIAPVSDQDQYGEAERWTFPVDAGDCEDYLLLKKRYLEALGFPSSILLITVVLDEKSEGHAILTIVTDKGDYILDNRRNDIKRWTDTTYKFLKRQSQYDPKSWVALVKQATVASGAVATSKDN